MILLILCLFSSIFLVSSNPAHPRTNPNCPIHGQATYRNSAPPAHVHQPAYPNAIQHNHVPNNIGPTMCPTKNVAQIPVMGNQPGSPLQSEVGQMIVNRLLSNPALREILSQNSLLPNDSPNIVNNYFIVPKELFSHNKTKSKAKKNEKGNMKDGGRFNSKEEFENKLIPTSFNDDTDREIIDQKSYEDSVLQWKKNDGGHRRYEVNDENEFDADSECLAPIDRKYIRNNNHYDNEQLHITPKRFRQQSGSNYRKLPKKLKNSETQDEPDYAKLVSPKVAKNLDYNRASDRAKQGLPTDDAIVRDFRARFPGIPEHVVKNLLNHMKEHVQRTYPPKHPITNLHYPSNYPYERHSAADMTNHGEIPILSRLTKHRKTKNRVMSTEKPELVVALNPSIYEVEEPLVTTTEALASNMSNDKFTTESPRDVITTTDGNILETTTRYDQYETTSVRPSHKPQTTENTLPFIMNSHQNFRLPELGAEDEIPNIDENGIAEEYYPDFTVDNHAYTIFNDYDIPTHGNRNPIKGLNHGKRPMRYRNMVGNRYRGGLEVHRRQRERNGNNLRKKYHDTTTQRSNKKYQDESEEIVFRNPPGLESPDFVTKEVKRNYNWNPNYEFGVENDEHYETLETPYLIESEEEEYVPKREIKRIRVSSKSKNPNIETVFAGSKVINYGKTIEFSDEELEATTLKNSKYLIHDKGKSPKDSDSSVVIAKSFKDSDEYSW